MTWTPETNRIPWGLLTDDEKAALQVCEHGWERYNVYGSCEWHSVGDPHWRDGLIYRAKPAPKRVVAWHNVYSDWVALNNSSRADADRDATTSRLCVYRIERNEDGSDPTIEVEEA